MKRELKDLVFQLRDQIEKVTKPIPMKRELKVFLIFGRRHIPTAYVTKPIPMKRELKDWDLGDWCSRSRVTKPIPMKRELKDVRLLKVN